MTAFRVLNTSALLISLAAILSACGSDNATQSSENVDTTAPTARITFPPPTSMTEGGSIVVRGTAADASEITMLRVNGVDATSSDGFATWEATVSLAPGNNNLVVDVSDIASNTAAAAATAQILVVNDISVSNFPDALNALNGPLGIALDSANSRALVTNSFDGDVVAVDLTTGARTILSDGPSTLWGITLDSANNRALVSAGSEVVAVDLTSGTRTTLSSAAAQFGSNGITLDSANNRALVADFGQKAVIAVDLTTGARTILSDVTTPDAVNSFSGPVGITLDSANNRALVSDDFLSAVVAVDLTSGARTILSDNTRAFDIVIDSTNSRVLGTSGWITAVDTASGARTIISGPVTPDAVNAFSFPAGITIDSANNRALVTDDNLDAVFAVDLVNGQRVVISR